MEIIRSFPKNKAEYYVYEVTVDGVVYFAAKSKNDTWKVCSEQEVTIKTRQVPVLIQKKQCNIQLISLLDRMVLANSTVWAGPLPVILR